jgi:hypothetical protein
MLSKIIKRSCTGFVCGVAIQQFIIIIACLVVNKPNFVPLVPSYQMYFSSSSLALGVSSVLIGVISAVFSGSSVVFEIEKWSFLKQGLIHFLITTIVWLPISIFLWGLMVYQQAILNVFISFTATYAITWGIQYALCRKSIHEINQKLVEINKSQGN